MHHLSGFRRPRRLLVHFLPLVLLLVPTSNGNKAPNARLVTGDVVCTAPGSGMNAHCVLMAPDAYTFGVTSDLTFGVARCTKREVIDDQLAGGELCQFYDGQSTTIFCYDETNFVQVNFTLADSVVTNAQGSIGYAWQNAAWTEAAHSYVSDDVLSIVCLPMAK